ncbi:MAG TPA: GMC family oxidoreductase N-terminal domain-containing protein [Rhodothermales bacterium]|nr:GMC family oxidoreductase N-terminal domain-containing protein [Rhodothermales bacterium]
MSPLFHLRGYPAYDPLDAVPIRSRFLLAMGVTAIVSAAFLTVVFEVLNIATLRWSWLMWVETAAIALIFAPIVVILRRSSSVLLSLLLLFTMFPIELYVQSAYRDVGAAALWSYTPDGLLGGLPPVVQFIIVWVGDGIVVGPIALWLTRLVAGMFWRNRKNGPELALSSHYRELFSDEWTRETVAKPARDFSFYILLGVGLAYASYMIVVFLGFFGTSPWPPAVGDMLRQSFENPALTINTMIKVAIMGALALAGAYNLALRFHTSLALLVGHGVSTVFSLFFYFYDPAGTPYRDFLLTSAIVDTVLGAFFVYVMVKYKSYADDYSRDREFPVFYSIAHRVTRLFFLIFGSVLALIVPGVFLLRMLFDGTAGWPAVYGFPDPQVCNTLTKYATLSFLAFMIGPREALRERLVGVILLGYGTSVVVSSLWLLFGDMFGDVAVATRHGGSVVVDWYFMLNVVMDGIVFVSILAIRRMFYNVEYTITSLGPASARNVMAVHAALFAGNPDDSATILSSVDRHIGDMRGRKRGLLNFPFFLLEHVLTFINGLRPPMSVMSRDEQRWFLRRYILRLPQERTRAIVPILAEIVYKLGTAVHALVTLAHYSGKRGWGDTGFIPADARKRLQGDYTPPGVRPPSSVADRPKGPEDPANEKPLTQPPPVGARVIAPIVVTPITAPSIPDEVDYLVVGSGAGGATMAYRLATQVGDPAKVLVVERGGRFSPLQDMSEDEMEMTRRLYKEGGLQQTKRFDMMILQGECVGGTTVTNNGICIEMPPKIKAQWANQFGIDTSGLQAAYDRTKSDLGIDDIPDGAVNERVEAVFDRGVRNLNGAHAEPVLHPTRRLAANGRSLLGDGSWNLGNRRMRKRSMAETYLPWAEARGVQILSETSAARFHQRPDGTADAVTVRTKTGAHRRIKVNKAVVVAGGVIAGSHFLMRSGITANVGRNVACNFAFPIGVDFDEELDAFDGLQITLAGEDPQERAIFETYFNPPGSFSISLPFYFDRHREIMNRYRHVVNFGALVGSEPNGWVLLEADWVNGRSISWDLGERDRKNIKFALSTLVDLAHHAGARRAVIALEPGIEVPMDVESVKRFKSALANFPLEMSSMRLFTAHPQGGNRMGGPSVADRVVDEKFRVVGTTNVYVSDASVFPTGITVNPQWTIYAMADLASQEVVKHD